MTEGARLAGIRRDAAAAAVAVAALRAIRTDGGTSAERAGTPRVVRMIRHCAESVVEQVDAADRRDGDAVVSA